MTRSSLVYLATQKIPGRYELVALTAMAARALHKGQRMRTDRLADTISEAMARVSFNRFPAR